MNELTTTFDVRAMLEEREAVLAQLRQGLELIAEAHKRSVKAGLGGMSYTHNGPIPFSPDPSDWSYSFQKLRERMDNAGWESLLIKSRMRSFMDPQTTHRWEENLRQGSTPPLELSTIQATFAALYEGREAMFHEAVLQCYRRHSWQEGPKAQPWMAPENEGQPIALGARLVIECKSHSPHRWIEHAADLNRLFAVLEGQAEQDHRGTLDALCSEARRREEDTAATDYMRMKWFKNGNAHVQFLKPDLVARLNEIVGAITRGVLPAPGKYLRAGKG